MRVREGGVPFPMVELLLVCFGGKISSTTMYSGNNSMVETLGIARKAVFEKA